MGIAWINQGVYQPINTKLEPVKKLHKNTSARDSEVSEFQETLESSSLQTKTHSQEPYSQHSHSHAKQREHVVEASQIMTHPVICLSETHLVKDAWDLMASHQFRHIPVLSDQKQLIGLVSDRDLLRLAAEKGQARVNEWGILDIARKKVLTARPSAKIRDIAKILFEQRIGSIVIIDQYEFPIGMITRSDILKTLMNKAPLELWI